MHIAYGTYAIPDLPLQQAIPALAHLGYQGIEICLGPRHEDALPANLDAPAREALRAALTEHALEVPALFLLGQVFTEDAAQHQATLEHLRLCAQLGRDLGLARPVLAMGFGGAKANWESHRQRLVDLLGDVAAVAREEDFVFAGEAHCGAMVDRSERITWLLEAAHDERVRLHFDIVHLFLAGEAVGDAVAALLPYTAHTHITDAIRRPDGSFQLVLLGDGELDTVGYLAAMAKGGWQGAITLEVSTMVWGQPEYDWQAAAAQSYVRLARAFTEAGVGRA